MRIGTEGVLGRLREGSFRIFGCVAGLPARCGTSVYLMALRGAIAVRLGAAIRVAFVHGIPFVA